MADARRARPGQHARETTTLSYGHLGTATYDEGSHAWVFLRQHQSERDLGDDQANIFQHQSSRLRLVDERTLDLSADGLKGDTRPSRHATDGRGLKNLFLKNVPESTSILTGLATSVYATGVLEETSAETQPIANALALGYAQSPYEAGIHNHAPTTTIVALPAGRRREVLRVLGLEARHIEIRNASGQTHSCKLPYVTQGMIGHWCESADEILQVSSTSHAHGTQFLVVKSSGTTILRPVSGHATSEAPLQSSFPATFTPADLLPDPCPVVTMPTFRTGQKPHVHAAFNPESPNLVAVVDTSGQWSVWKLAGRSTTSARVPYQVHLQGSGSLITSARQSRFKMKALHRPDWYRVCWLRGSGGLMDRILVCDQREVAIFDRMGKLLNHADMRLGLLSGGNLILDVRNSNIRRHDGHKPENFIVLTTSRIMIFSSIEGVRDEELKDEPIRLVCSWSHSRDRADPGLRMAILESSKGTCTISRRMFFTDRFAPDSWVLLWSTASTFAVMYHFGYQETRSDVVSLQDPSTFPLPPQVRDRIGDIQDIILRPVKFTIREEAPEDADYGLIKLIACTSGGELIEALYKHELPQFCPAESLPEAVPVLALPQASRLRLPSTQYIEEEDVGDFLVFDARTSPHLAEHTFARRDALGDSHRNSLLMRDWQRLLIHLTPGDDGREDSSFGSSLHQAVEQYGRLKRENDLTPFQLISDLVDNCSILDVEEDSKIAEGWVESLALRADVGVESVALQNLPQSSNQQVLSYYNHMIDTFVHPLSEGITDRNRVNRERLVRQVVGPVLFGTWMLKNESVTHIFNSPQLDPLSAQPTRLALSSPGPDSDDQKPSQMSTPEISIPPEEPAVTRLRRYATFVRQVPSLLLDQSTATATVLGHLPSSIQDDPAEYSYQNTNSKLKLLQEQVAAESLDPKERQKALKSAVRRQRKLEKSKLMSQEVMLRRTLLPGIGTGVGPAGLPGREVQSSQAAVPGSSQKAEQDVLPGLTMTQPERGAFGTRQTVKKGKKRRAGF